MGGTVGVDMGRDVRTLRITLVALVLIAGCGKEHMAPEPEPSSWSIIRDRVFAPNCAGCHAEGTTFAVQSGLILTPNVAYSQLIDVRPKTLSIPV